jgi:Flp pilus assembly protein TadG
MRGILTFLRDERGSQTIEFVLWLPIIGALLVVISYASILYMTHTEMWNVARDTARRLTVRTLLPADAEVYARSQLKLYDVFGTDYQIVATEDAAASTMTVVITLGVADGSFDAGFFGAFSLVGGTMAARVVMRSAPT